MKVITKNSAKTLEIGIDDVDAALEAKGFVPKAQVGRWGSEYVRRGDYRYDDGSYCQTIGLRVICYDFPRRGSDYLKFDVEFAFPGEEPKVKSMRIRTKAELDAMIRFYEGKAEEYRAADAAGLAAFAEKLAQWDKEIEEERRARQ